MDYSWARHQIEVKKNIIFNWLDVPCKVGDFVVIQIPKQNKKNEITYSPITWVIRWVWATTFFIEWDNRLFHTNRISFLSDDISVYDLIW
jgi:hypothetical protein